MKLYKHTNLLVHESSPYLLQHAHNPVDWHPWNEETLQKAQKEDKMILVSIGYSACHWCHVMEHESFEDEEVAKAMNEDFICIKVDREERPDVDQVYMDAVQTISGRGGWPLNCFALPDGKPFWGATYFRRDQWLDIVKNVVKLFNTQRNKLEQQAADIYEGISTSSFIDPDRKEIRKSTEIDLDEMAYTLGNRIDRDLGGFKGAPKFPMPVNFLFLLRYHFYTGNPEALELLELTLGKMSKGGIYDQIGGGFARYSVDDRWHVPHFEKMLYDNAQLISLYSEAYRCTQKPQYRDVIIDTMEFVRRELTAPDGGFYSALDADSEGEEGKYYVWTQEEFESVCGDQVDLATQYFGVGEEAYWEDGKNVLIQAQSVTDLAIKNQLPVESVSALVDTIRKKLLDARAERSRPALDDKILTSWNGLMLSACLDAYRAIGTEAYLQTALKNADFIVHNLFRPEGRLSRTFKAGAARIEGFLEDYSFVADAFISLYEVTFDEEWLLRAKKLADTCIELFKDPTSGLFYFTSSLHSDTIARKIDVVDNVIPSSNSVLAGTFLKLAQLFGEKTYFDLASGMMSQVAEKMLKFPSAFGQWGTASMSLIYDQHTAVMGGPDVETIRKGLLKCYTPNTLLAGATQDSKLLLAKERWSNSKTQVFVCTGNACRLPVESVEEVIAILKESP